MTDAQYARAHAPIDEVLQAIRGAIEPRHREILDRAETLRAAADAYAIAATRALAVDLARRFGVAAPSGPTPAKAATHLRDVVSALPELGDAPREPIPDCSEQGVRPTPHERAGRPPSPTSPEAQALWAELEAADWSAMPTPLFKATAAEFAARARSIQEQHDDEPIPTRIIRRLTALAGERGIRSIFGLSRRHTGDWVDLAETASLKRKQCRDHEARCERGAHCPDRFRQRTLAVRRTPNRERGAAPGSCSGA